MEAERVAYEERKLVYLSQYQTQHRSSFEQMLGVEQWHLDASEAAWKASLTNKLDMTASMFKGWSSLMMTESKRAFRVGKAAAITETVIAGLSASIKAYQALAGIWLVGPALGAVAAAGILAQTGVTVSKIKQQQFGGAAASASVSTSALKAPSVSGSGAGGAPPGGDGQKLEITNIVNIDGEQVYESVKSWDSAAHRAGRGDGFVRVA